MRADPGGTAETYQGDEQVLRAILNRAQVRGSKLDPECYKCKNVWEMDTNQDGMIQSANFCYGEYDMMTDEKVDRCQNCKAHVDFVEEWSRKVREEGYTDGKSRKTEGGTPEPD